MWWYCAAFCILWWYSVCVSIIESSDTGDNEHLCYVLLPQEGCVLCASAFVSWYNPQLPSKLISPNVMSSTVTGFDANSDQEHGTRLCLIVHSGWVACHTMFNSSIGMADCVSSLPKRSLQLVYISETCLPVMAGTSWWATRRKAIVSPALSPGRRVSHYYGNASNIKIQNISVYLQNCCPNTLIIITHVKLSLQIDW